VKALPAPIVAAVTAALAACLAAGTAAGGGSRTQNLAFRQIASGFTDPTYVTSAPGDPATLYVVEQTGRVQIVRGGHVTGTLLDIRDRVSTDDQERGLLSIAFHPGYATNHLFYADYTDTHGGTRVVEFNSATNAERPLLFVAQPHPNHNGGQLMFDRAGYLYVGMGDGGSIENVPGNDPERRAQDPHQLLGKLLRINPTRAGATWQMIALGLRNPWRFSFDRKTGDMWIGDVGAGAQEEVDFRPKAQIGKLANYGWSRYEGTAPYWRTERLAKKGKLIFPVWTYAHGDGSLCSVIGGFVYRSSTLPAAHGRYFLGDFCLGTIWSFKSGRRVAPLRRRRSASGFRISRRSARTVTASSTRRRSTARSTSSGNPFLLRGGRRERLGLDAERVELRERLAPRVGRAQVEPERRDEVGRRGRTAGSEELEVLRRKGLGVLAVSPVEQEGDELRKRVRIRVEAHVDEVRDVGPAQRVPLGQRERVAVVVAVLLEPELVQPLRAERATLAAHGIGALLEPREHGLAVDRGEGVL
jgi:glucose/arabinose dehydrogenase